RFRGALSGRGAPLALVGLAGLTALTSLFGSGARWSCGVALLEHASEGEQALGFAARGAARAGRQVVAHGVDVHPVALAGDELGQEQRGGDGTRVGAVGDVVQV